MRFAWGQSLSCGRGCMSIVWLVTTVHLGRVDLRMSCGCFLKTWRTCATWGISGDVCHMYIVLFCRYTNHILKVESLELTTGTSVICHRLHVRHLYLAPSFFWWRMYRTGMLHIIHAFILHEEANLENQINLKIDSNLKSYLENLSNFNTLWSLRPVVKFWVSTLFRELMEFPMTSTF
jgi:hypothetical protein